MCIQHKKYDIYVLSSFTITCVYKAITVTIYIHRIVTSRLRHAMAQSVEARLLKSEGRVFDSQWDFPLT